MTMKALPVLFSALLAFPISAFAQPGGEPAAPTNTADSLAQNRFWQASVGGGHYMVALDRISAISRHRYVLDGAVIVDEVSVDALGQALVRFYYITPITDAVGGSEVANAAKRIADRGRELVDKVGANAGTDVHNMVVKKFPDTTHARSIEYRVMSEQELTALYSSVRTAWETGKGRRFTIK
jgi:hypothetical protein